MYNYINPAYVNEGQEELAKEFDKILDDHLPEWARHVTFYFWDCDIPAKADFIEEAQKLAAHVESEYPDNAEEAAQ